MNRRLLYLISLAFACIFIVSAARANVLDLEINLNSLNRIDTTTQYDYVPQEVITDSGSENIDTTLKWW